MIQHFTTLKMEHIHPLKGTIMFKNAIRTLGKILFHTILETVLSLLALVLLTKMVELYFAKTTPEAVAETDESTNSED